MSYKWIVTCFGNERPVNLKLEALCHLSQKVEQSDSLRGQVRICCLIKSVCKFEIKFLLLSETVKVIEFHSKNNCVLAHVPKYKLLFGTNTVQPTSLRWNTSWTNTSAQSFREKSRRNNVLSCHVLEFISKQTDKHFSFISDECNRWVHYHVYCSYDNRIQFLIISAAPNC